VVDGGGNESVSVGTKGVCVPADAPTFKSVEVQNGGFKSESNSTLEVQGASYL